MEFEIKEGTKEVMEITVTSADTAAHYGSGLIEVFATPAMIGLMESTAQSAIQKFLPEGYITLGIEVNIQHLKATPVGMKVKCEAVITKVEGKKITLEVKAWDEQGLIGSGTHVRFIVQASKFMEKLKSSF
jgi:fluoroacetyl-CoA thioesterase